jgi:Flp pilus assembly protein TadG
MRSRIRSHPSRSWNCEGITTVEMAIVLSVFLMLFLGIFEFGYDWYLQSVLNNAAYSGARYGVAYTTSGTNTPTAPKDLGTIPNTTSPSISNYVKTGPDGNSGLESLLPTEIYNTVQVTCSGTGYTSSTRTAGAPLTVTVNVTVPHLFLGNLFNISGSISGTATLNVE